MQTDTGNNRSRAWNMGTRARMRNLRSGESGDILTGTDWDEGIATKNRFSSAPHPRVFSYRSVYLAVDLNKGLAITIIVQQLQFARLREVC